MSLRALFLSMRAVRLDDETADRMLAGKVDPADAPPGYTAVAELLETARTAAGMPVPAASAAWRPSDLGVTQATSTGRTVRRTRSGRRRIPVLAAVAFCAMTGGAYAAGATGAGSGTVSAVLDRIGVGSFVGSPSGDHGQPASGRAALKGEASATTGAAAAAPVGAGHDTSGDDTVNSGPGKHGKGNAHGVAVSTAASDGKSHAGQHGNGNGGTHPSHPAHPAHPAHPTHPAHPSHPSHPSHPTGGHGGGQGPKHSGS